MTTQAAGKRMSWPARLIAALLLLAVVFFGIWNSLDPVAHLQIKLSWWSMSGREGGSLLQAGLRAPESATPAELLEKYFGAGQPLVAIEAKSISLLRFSQAPDPNRYVAALVTSARGKQLLLFTWEGQSWSVRDYSPEPGHD